MTHDPHPNGPAASRPPARDRIIQAALALIAEEGLGAVTMVRIATTAGVARQTLYNYYPDVESIVAAAIEQHNQESLRLLESALRVVDEPTGRLEQLVRHVVAVAAHGHRHTAGIEHGLSAEARATLGEYHDALDRQVREVLAEGQRRGVFRQDLAPDLDAVLVRHMLNGLAEQSATTPDAAATIATTGARTVIAAVAARQPDARPR